MVRQNLQPIQFLCFFLLLLFLFFSMSRLGLPDVTVYTSASTFNAVSLQNVRVGVFAQAGNDFFTNFLFSPRIGSVVVYRKTKVNKITDESRSRIIGTFPCNFTNPLSGKVISNFCSDLLLNLNDVGCIWRQRHTVFGFESSFACITSKSCRDV
jgi:hypothetical protein